MRISEKDKARWLTMTAREDALRRRGYLRIAGVDEAGRGPLAGPVVAAAVVLGDRPLYGVNDSKKVTPARRDALYDLILDSCDVTIAQVSAAEIDSINILQATKKAMRLAINKLHIDYVLIDAMTVDGLSCQQEPIIKGDANVNAIAAASIVAKVTRDRLMCLYDIDYPDYGFAAHKGYGTAKHMDAIRRLGPTSIHRQTFLTRL